MRIFTTITLLFLLSRVIAQESISGQTDKFYLDLTAIHETKSNLSVPEIAWKNPQIQYSQYNNRRYNLQLNVRSKIGLENLSIYLNDYPVVKQRGLKVVSVKSLNEFEKLIDTEILLRPGLNKVRVTAKNKDGGTSTSIREINVVVDEESVLANRKDHAILFATDNYDHWDNLQNPINDINTIAMDLKAIYGFEVETVTNPSKREVLQKLREYTKKNFMPNDQLFIMFAGHGHYDQLFNQGYLVCRDSKISDEERVSYISHNNLRSIIDNIPNKHIFLTMDACFGGTFDPFIRSSAHRGLGVYDELDNGEYINRKLKLKTRKFLTSGGKGICF